MLLLDWAFSQAYVRLDDTHLAAAPNASAMYRDPNELATAEADRAEYEEFYASSGADADVAAAAAGNVEEIPEDDDVDADGDHDEL